MGGEARELGRATRTAAVSRPPCALATLQQPLTARNPPRPGAAYSSWHRNCWGGWGRGSCYLLRQKDAGQHFICNHLNVLLFLEFRTLVGVPGRWVRRASICLVVGGGAGRSCWHICSNQPSLCCLGASLERGLCPGSHAFPSLASVFQLSPLLPCPAPFPCSWPGPVPMFNPTHLSFQQTSVYYAAPRQNLLHKSNLYIWQIKLDIIVKKIMLKELKG